MGDQENKSDRHRGGSPLRACRPFVSRRPSGPAAGKLLCLAAGWRHSRPGTDSAAQPRRHRLSGRGFHAFRAESHGNSAADRRGLAVYFKFSDHFGGSGQDPRGFTVSKEGTYGTASWMGEKELKEVLKVEPLEKAEDILLGKWKGKAVCLPADTRLNRHIAVFGASGTGKSRGLIRPALFNIIRRGESAVITDSKGELYADTAELFRRHGYKVKVFNLVNPEHGGPWNCMAGLGGDTLLAQVLTNVIIGNTSSGKTDHFWDNGEGNLLKAPDPLRGSGSCPQSPGEKISQRCMRCCCGTALPSSPAPVRAASLDHPARGAVLSILPGQRHGAFWYCAGPGYPAPGAAKRSGGPHPSAAATST